MLNSLRLALKYCAESSNGQWHSTASNPNLEAYSMASGSERSFHKKPRLAEIFISIALKTFLSYPLKNNLNLHRFCSIIRKLERLNSVPKWY
jgi:hypothetical protein